MADEHKDMFLMFNWSLILRLIKHAHFDEQVRQKRYETAGVDP